jgi:hypothetical protein
MLVNFPALMVAILLVSSGSFYLGYMLGFIHGGAAALRWQENQTKPEPPRP